MQLIPLESVFARNASGFKISQYALMYAMEKLKLSENLHGEIQGTTFRCLNGKQFEVDLDDRLLDGEIPIVDINDSSIVIDGFPLTQEQRADLESRIDFFKSWTSMPTDIFYLLVEREKIYGKDLISLCLADPLIDEKCNSRDQELFKRLLSKQFDISIPKNPRQEYIALSASKIYTFGSNSDGQLGNGNVQEGLKQLRPEPIVGFEGILQVSCGSDYTAFLDIKGRVWTFGDPGSGKLGYKTRLQQNKPRMIKGFEGIKNVSCGISHTGMVDSDGRVWTFGNGDDGQLGHGDETDVYHPKMILGLPIIKQISCGRNHTVLLDEKGRVWTFGVGDDGRLGHGDRIDRYSPKMIVGFENMMQVSCGGTFTAILDSRGRMWTFGNGDDGQLGHGDEQWSDIPKMIEGFEGIKQISCGSVSAVFIDSEGQIWSFGYGRHENWVHIHDMRPVMIDGFRNIKSVDRHGTTITAFIDSDNHVWTFGNGRYGKLGHGDENHQDRPKMIEGFANVKHVSCGSNHMAFIV
jgi:alpha-tubulin suppressor-like RCC1 family protein